MSAWQKRSENEVVGVARAKHVEDTGANVYKTMNIVSPKTLYDKIHV